MKQLQELESVCSMPDEERDTSEPNQHFRDERQLIAAESSTNERLSSVSCRQSL
jgi:hypothetical protein